MTESSSYHRNELRKLLLTLIAALAILLILVSYAFNYFAQQFASDVVDSYLAKQALYLGFEDINDAQTKQLIAKLNDDSWTELQLNAKDINLLLAQKLRWQERFYLLDIQDNLLHVLVSWPLTNSEPDNYLAGQAVMRLVFTAGLLHFELVDFQYQGKPVPAAFLANAPIENLVGRMLEDSESRAIISFVRTLQGVTLKQNHILLMRQANKQLS